MAKKFSLDLHSHKPRPLGKRLHNSYIESIPIIKTRCPSTAHKLRAYYQQEVCIVM
jgi:hypothetical protein